MGRRSERLSREGILASDLSGEGDVIQVVSRAFDVLRCFEGHDIRLGNLEISSRCGLPRSTVSRLTHTLTRMGQLVYLPNDQKYRIGPSAVAMSTSLLRGLQLRNLIRSRLQDTAEHVPGTVGFVVPDRFHLVYLEYARAPHALGLNSSTGSRIAMTRTAAGHAYVAALDPPIGDALLADIERELPKDAPILRDSLAANRIALAEQGYVTACGLWSPHINGIAAPIWSPQYQTYVVITIGLLAAMYDDARMRDEIAPQLAALQRDIKSLIDSGEGGFYDEARPSAASSVKQKETHKNGETHHELAAGAGRTRAARSVRASDGRA
jgi:DNA-binding IclR family transcriptional regulator